ncbi:MULTISPECIES: recombinase family protein [Paenibacillus]|jgi:Site-specific recombinases, DNA invertase Pin homologs|uniref:Resolvase n=1 Tax=Paenibacillus aceti TaxID=1820010 RepID=A0ABQ1VQI1_9BACL|nr:MULTISPECIES: recombinase family protein [Paenibacillus]MDU5141866.1 recombinase family protein [Paenibacillus dendritiformis]GGF88864.1 resolvase [Paenibacillus aceti]
MPKYGYARVSTVGQSRHGNSLEHQVNQLLSEGVAQSFIFVDNFTGSKMDRPQFTKLLQILKAGDTLVVTKLDRFARSTVEGEKIVKNLIERGVRIHILNMGILDNTPTSILIRTIFFAFAEFERNMIIERTAEGKAIAKQKVGFREGRPPKFTKLQLDHAINLLQTHSMNEVVGITRISESTLKRELRRRRSPI